MMASRKNDTKEKLKPILKSKSLRKSKSDTDLLGIEERKRNRSVPVRFDKKVGQALDPDLEALRQEDETKTRRPKSSRKKEPLHLFPDPNAEPVRMYVCKAVTLRKWLIFCLVLQFISLIVVISVWSCTYYLWPLTFAIDFQRGPTFMRNRIVILFLGIEPLYNFLFLILAIHLPKKLNCFLRVYYLASPYLLIMIAFVGFHALLFVGNFKRIDLERELEEGILSYQGSKNDSGHPRSMKHTWAKKGWDDLQNFFKCCGIQEAEDWKRGFIDVKVDGEWHVPESCCVTGAKDCKTNPNPRNTWQRGCLDPAFELFVSVGSMTAALAIAILFITVFCIFIAAEYYSALRRGDGSDYVMNVKTYCREFFCIGCFCCCRRRGNAKVEPKIDWDTKNERSKSEDKNRQFGEVIKADILNTKPNA